MYITCNTQEQINLAEGPAAELRIEFPPDMDARVRLAMNVQVVSCRDFDARDAKIGNELNADGAEIGGDFDARDAKIGRHFYVGRATIGCDFNIAGATIGGEIILERTKIGRDINIAGTTIGGEIILERTRIGGNFNAIGATIGGVVVCKPTPEHRAILASIRDQIKLDMNMWHGREWDPSSVGTCGTTHCLAGGAQALSTDPAIRTMEPHEAGKILLPCCAHLFFAPESVVQNFIKANAAE